MSLNLNLRLCILTFSLTPYNLYSSFLKFCHYHLWSGRVTKMVVKPWTTSKTGSMRNCYSNIQVQPLAPSLQGSKYHRQSRPKLTSFLQASLLSIWQLTSIKEGGRNYLNSFTRLAPLPPFNYRKVTDISITSSVISFPCMLRFCNAM